MVTKHKTSTLAHKKGGERLTTEKLEERLRSRLEFEKGPFDNFADFLTRSFGTVWFFILNAIFFAVWIAINQGIVPGIEPFDPFPYGLLTMVVSLEAIFLSVIVLISQNRQSRNTDIRQMMDFEIDVRSEEEVTRMLVMLSEMHRHLGIRQKHDNEFKVMTQKIDLAQIQKKVEEEE